MTLIKYIIANISNNFNFVLKYIFFLRRIADVTAMSLLSDLPANKEWIKSGVNGLIVTDLNSNFIREAIHFDQDKMGSFNRNIAISEGNFRNVLLKLINN